MNSHKNGIPEQIRERLTEAPWGSVVTPVPPGVKPALPAMDGTSSSKDLPDEETEDALDMYLSGMVDSLLNQYDATEEEAADTVFAAIDHAVEHGKLPEMPADGADDQEVSLWVGKATIANLSRIVNEYARSNAEE